jgi:putative SOS response-associated peptidase YedK
VCGRYVQAREIDDLLAEFEAEDALNDEPAVADYNVAPTKPVPVVLNRHRRGDRGGPIVRQVRIARWGLVPSWAPDLAGAARRINARVETVARLPAFRSALARRRCLVPADGWYEWAQRPDGAGRQAYYLTPRDGSGLAFAGLYEIWPAGRVLTCSIVTTAAVGELARVHDRMPLLLPREAWAGWLDPRRSDPGSPLAGPAAELIDRLEVRPVGAAVGNVASSGPDLVAPVRLVPAVPGLF